MHDGQSKFNSTLTSRPKWNGFHNTQVEWLLQCVYSIKQTLDPMAIKMYLKNEKSILKITIVLTKILFLSVSHFF